MKKTCMVITTSLLFGLSGCGGGGGEIVSSTVPEGVYEGLTSDNEYFNLLVLENGLYYSMNGTVSGGVFDVDSLSTGTGSSSNGRFESGDFKQFFGNGTSLTGSLNARFNLGGSFSGTLTDGSLSVTFSGDKVDSSVHDYNQAANLASITGTWNNLRTLNGNPVTLTVAGSGSFTGTVSGTCTITGQLTPRASGKNVFDATVNFGAAPCVPANQSFTGHAVEFDLGGGTQQLAIAGTDASRTNGMLLLGLR